MPKFAYVYSGDGASQRSILSTIESLKASFVGIQVRQLCALDLLEGGWQDDAALLCFPGGADLPYCQFLNGSGNKMIVEYVRSGGAYLGLCAGGYYACSRIEFEKDRPLEVCGLRELGFFPGMGKGPIQDGFEYNTEAGTAAVPIRFRENDGAEEWCQCRDYSNGGPCFILEGDQSQAVDILAEYTLESSSTCQEPPASDCQEAAAVLNGATRAAAVRCQVGAGVAVLCGTHPELSPWWLDANCQEYYIKRTCPELSQDRVKRLVQSSKEIRASLKEDQPKRERFWKQLLIAAGLEGNLQSALPSDCIHPIAKGLQQYSQRRRYRDRVGPLSIPDHSMTDTQAMQSLAV